MHFKWLVSPRQTNKAPVLATANRGMEEGTWPHKNISSNRQPCSRLSKFFFFLFLFDCCVGKHRLLLNVCVAIWLGESVPPWEHWWQSRCVSWRLHGRTQSWPEYTCSPELGSAGWSPCAAEIGPAGYRRAPEGWAHWGTGNKSHFISCK